MKNPTIEELQNAEYFDKIGELSHHNIKNFIREQLVNGGLMVKVYMVYQLVMILVGIFFITRVVLLAINGNSTPALYIAVAAVFCFSGLIIVHELLHGAAIKITGAPKVSYGGYLKQFVFYAEADQYVLNRRQFSFIAVTPLIVIKLTTLVAILLFFSHPISYAMIFIMSAHSLFCAGDIGLLSVFYQHKSSEVYTYDVKAEKKSYFFKKRSEPL